MFIKPAVKLFFVFMTILLTCVIAWACLKLRKPFWRDAVMVCGARTVLWFVGVRVKVSGQQSARRPLLIISNHLSYLDILVLGSTSVMRFTPKQEIADWPLFGWLCKLHGAFFVDRRVEQVKNVGDMIHEGLLQGEAICLFPEATTGNGLHLLPFKSSFFSLAEAPINDEAVAVQPVAIAYTHIRNLPIGMTQWPDVAWYGDMDLVPHLWNLLKIAPISVHLKYLEPVTAEQFGGRKGLAAYCQQTIADAIKG